MEMSEYKSEEEVSSKIQRRGSHEKHILEVHLEYDHYIYKILIALFGVVTKCSSVDSTKTIRRSYEEHNSTKNVVISPITIQK